MKRSELPVVVLSILCFMYACGDPETTAGGVGAEGKSQAVQVTVPGPTAQAPGAQPQVEPPSVASPTAPASATAAPAARDAGKGAADASTAIAQTATAPAAVQPRPSQPAAPPTLPSAEAVAPVADPRVSKLLDYDPADPLADLEKADALAAGPSATPTLAGGGRCRAIGAPQRLAAGALDATVVAAGDAFVVAGYERIGEREQVRLLSLPQRGLPTPLRTLPLQHAHPGPRRALPALHAMDAHHVALAVVDGKGRLLMLQLPLRRAAAAANFRKLADGVDSRFAPSIAHVDTGALVAWTVGSTPMAMRYALVPADSKTPLSADLTPHRQGAAGATFVQGASPPLLVAVDARDGMSPLIVVPFDDKGMPGTARPAGPVGMVSSPTQLTAARAGFGAVLGYTGLGNAATSAVGVVGLDAGGASPEALVKGTAYGPLHVSAAPAQDHVVFAVDAPLRGGKAPPHELQLLRVDGAGVKPLGALRAGDEDLSHVSLARAPGGLLALVYRAAGGTYASRLRCN